MTVSQLLLFFASSLLLSVSSAPTTTRTFIVKRYQVNADELNEVIPQSSRVIKDDKVLNAVIRAVSNQREEQSTHHSTGSADEEDKFESKVMPSQDAKYLGRPPLVLPYPNTMAGEGMFPPPPPPPPSHAMMPQPQHMSPVSSSSAYEETTRVTSHSFMNNPHSPNVVRETSYKEIHRTSPDLLTGATGPSSPPMSPPEWHRSSPGASFTGQPQGNGDVFLSLTPPLVFSLNLG